ncbi:YoqW [Alkalihalophilus pseudofirmus OF4]|uniref:Abasic site processing protein n=1 Tax=Alkalihalophilus pseudofirmus (strain ATCC BAA-2126 / JCM 17055 / OF4) TaxID=398511 RepID=D3FQT6_ALKPO|nr:SOS response-associated peptidase [Alkalihalophilus pseudofirmus]ADC51456.1 YoqW [Alkalihalophilus pseudofirmus OF4]
MCGRFTLTATKEQIEKQLNVHLDDYEPRFNIAPSQPVLSVISDGKKRKAGYLKWGLVPVWAKDPKIGYKMINARGETVDEKPAFKRLLKRRRCLIVTDGFYEWKRTDETKQPYRITVNDRIFTFAGLWDRWKSGDEEIVSCTILTTAPNEFMRDIHDRMPVILGDEERKVWLDPSIEDKEIVKDIIKPYPAQYMTAHEVSTYVNNPRNESEECIKSLSE